MASGTITTSPKIIKKVNVEISFTNGVGTYSMAELTANSVVLPIRNILQITTHSIVSAYCSVGKVTFTLADNLTSTLAINFVAFI